VLRHSVQTIGRWVTRMLLHPRWRTLPWVSSTYARLYLLGKAITERHEVSRLETLVTPGMTIIDVGANVGFYTLKMAAAAGDAGRVLAFEPDPFNFVLLKDRISRSHIRNVEPFQAALGDRAGRAVLYSSAYNRADNRLSASHDEAHVEASEIDLTTLDDVLKARGITSVNGMKVDVQGHELHVIRGARRTLQQGLQWIWIEFSPDHLRASGTDPDDFLATLGGLGMDVFELTDEGALRTIDNYQEHTRRIGSGYGDLLLLARPGSA
jgi:FkbM family methyltransferase